MTVVIINNDIQKPPKFNNHAQWYIYRMAKFLSPLYKIIPKNSNLQKDIVQAEEELHNFFNYLYNDMYNNPQEYKIPLDSFIINEQFNKKRLKVRKIVLNCVLDFLYKIGQLSDIDNNKLIVEQKVWYDLLAEKNKKIKSEQAFTNILSRLGFRIKVKGLTVEITHNTYSQMLIALNYFAKICAKDKKNGFRFFYQLDFRCFNNHKLELTDVVRLLPSLLKDEVIETYLLLKQLKYRLKIEPYEDHGYRLVYSNKAGVVYYVLINSYETENYYHYVRWVLNTAQTDYLINDLEKDNFSNVIEYLLENLIECDQNCVPGYGASSPEACKARVKIYLPFDKKFFYTCKDKGCVIGTADFDFQYVRILLTKIQNAIYRI